MSTTRYSKPLVRLLECYVLHAIGQLSESDSVQLKEMQPKLAQVYKCEKTWNAIIETVMKFPQSMPDLIRDNWQKNQEIALLNGVVLNPQQFAEMFVDQNFIAELDE